MTRWRVLAAAAVALCVSACATASTGPQTWRKVTTPNFEVISQIDEAKTARLAVQLEQFRLAALALTNTKSFAPALPTRVLVFANEEAFKEFTGHDNSVGLYAASARQRVMLISADGQSFSALEILFHEYVHALLDRSSVRYPRWYEEGLAEFLSTVKIGNGKATIGRPPARWALARMQTSTAPATGTHIRIETRGEQVSDYYGRAWAEVAFLTLGHLSKGRDPDRRSALAKFLRLYSEGRDHDAAVREAFGFDFGTLQRKAVAYVRQDAFPLVDVPVPTATIEPTEMQELPDVELHLALALAARIHGRLDAARRNYERVLDVGPEPRALAGLARVHQLQGATDKVMDLLEPALAWPNHSVDVELEAAEVYRDLAWDLDAQQPSRRLGLAARAQEHAQRAVELAPELPAGHLALGYALGLDPDRRGDAIAAFDRALELLPRNAQVNLALGYHLRFLGELEAARVHLREVLRAPKPGKLAEQAQALLDGMPESSTAPVAPSPAESNQPETKCATDGGDAEAEVVDASEDGPSRAAIEEHMKSRVMLVRYCYALELQVAPMWSGTVSAELDIGRDGSVESVSAAGRGSRGFRTCVANAIKTVRFPRPACGRRMTVHYPFDFCSPKDARRDGSCDVPAQ